MSWRRKWLCWLEDALLAWPVNDLPHRKVLRFPPQEQLRSRLHQCLGFLCGDVVRRHDLKGLLRGSGPGILRTGNSLTPRVLSREIVARGMDFLLLILLFFLLFPSTLLPAPRPAPCTHCSASARSVQLLPAQKFLPIPLVLLCALL